MLRAAQRTATNWRLRSRQARQVLAQGRRVAAYLPPVPSCVNAMAGMYRWQGGNAFDTGVVTPAPTRRKSKTSAAPRKPACSVPADRAASIHDRRAQGTRGACSWHRPAGRASVRFLVRRLAGANWQTRQIEAAHSTCHRVHGAHGALRPAPSVTRRWQMLEQVTGADACGAVSSPCRLRARYAPTSCRGGVHGRRSRPYGCRPPAPSKG